MIRIISLDFDGCLFHRAYLDSIDKNVISANQEFLEYLNKSKDKYSKTTIMIGSNRQDKRTDLINSRSSGSCFPAIKRIADFLDVELDTFLLADVYGDEDGDFKTGTSFARIMEHYPGKHATAEFDEFKSSLLYAQIQKSALDHFDEEIVFDFYDDKIEILNFLEDFYRKNPFLLPKKVKLCLHQYVKGELKKDFRPIHGTGFIDGDYRLTTKGIQKGVRAEYLKRREVRSLREEQIKQQDREASQESHRAKQIEFRKQRSELIEEINNQFKTKDSIRCGPIEINFQCSTKPAISITSDKEDFTQQLMAYLKIIYVNLEMRYFKEYKNNHFSITIYPNDSSLTSYRELLFFSTQKIEDLYKKIRSTYYKNTDCPNKYSSPSSSFRFNTFFSYSFELIEEYNPLINQDSNELMQFELL